MVWWAFLQSVSDAKVTVMRLMSLKVQLLKHTILIYKMEITSRSNASYMSQNHIFLKHTQKN